MHDTQWTTPHLAMYGGHEIPNKEYMKLLERALRVEARFVDDLA